MYISRISVHALHTASTGTMKRQVGIMCPVADEVSFNPTSAKRRKIRISQKQLHVPFGIQSELQSHQIFGTSTRKFMSAISTT
jgi:hypothetical protein